MNEQPRPENEEMAWSVLVGDAPEGGVRWRLHTDHRLWIGQAAMGRAASEAEAHGIAWKLVQRCTEAVEIYLNSGGTQDVKFALMNVFPNEPAGGGATVGRLSAEPAATSAADDRWSDLEARAYDWQTRGGRQTFVALDCGEAESGWRLRELFGCMGAIGEQTMLACAAARDLERAVDAADSARSELVRRAWAEHVMHWLMAAGHMFLNVAGRTVALDPAVRQRLLLGGPTAPGDDRARKGLGTDFPQESDAHVDWPVFNKKHANLIRLAAQQSEVKDVVAIADLLHRVAIDPRWTSMSALRGEALHRWRAQTLGVSTMTRRMTRIVGADGRLPNGELPNVRGPEGSAGVVASAQQALALLAEAFTEYDRLLPGVLRALTSTVMHDDGLLSSFSSTLILVESARGTGVTMLPIRPERVESFLRSISAMGGTDPDDEPKGGAVMR